MRKYSKFFLVLFVIISFQTKSFAQAPSYVDFKYILNQSKAGKDAQLYLKNKLDNGVKDLKAQEKKIQDEEKKLIQQKKLITPEEYKSKVTDLRKKVETLRNQKDKLFNSVNSQRTKARTELLKNLNPIIKDYMKANKIRVVLDKKAILLADENLDITKQITDLLNKKLKTIKLN